MQVLLPAEGEDTEGEDTKSNNGFLTQKQYELLQ